MYKTATEWAKDIHVSRSKLIQILAEAGVFHSVWHGFWDTAEIHYRKRGSLQNKEVECFMYDLDKVHKEFALNVIDCGRVAGRSKNAKKYLVRQCGV